MNYKVRILIVTLFIYVLICQDRAPLGILIYSIPPPTSGNEAVLPTEKFLSCLVE